MLTKTLPTLLLVASIMVYTNASCQVKSRYKNQDFEKKLNDLNLTAKTITKIKKLIKDKNESLSQAKYLKASLIESAIYFDDEELSEEYINIQFKKTLAEILSFEQFGKLFRSQLQYKIDRTKSLKWERINNLYKLNQDQEKEIKKLIEINSEREILTREYYSYDQRLSDNAYQKEQLASQRSEGELIREFGMVYSKDQRTDLLIKRMKVANIDIERMNQILVAIDREEQKQNLRNITWYENYRNQIVHFHDEDDTEDRIRMQLREEIGKILNYEEFKSVFLEQMQNRIARETEKEFNQILSAYQQLDKTQADTVRKLVYEKNVDKIATEQYYKYSWDLYQQKLRAVTFRHEKIIRETIVGFNSKK